MVERPGQFDYRYVSSEIVYGRGCVETLSETLADAGFERALVVCGSNVGANRAVMDPLEAGLADRLGGVFDETTPEKRIETVLDGVDRITADSIDVLVGVGGGSSLNVMRAMSSIAALEADRDSVLETVTETGSVPAPDQSQTPIPNIAIPTTMAGADLSVGGSVFYDAEPETDKPLLRRAGIGDSRLRAMAAFYDPELFATTPTSVLASSAMNGFNKGIETLYSRSTNALCDANAISGLSYYCDSLPHLTAEPLEETVIDKAVLGTIQIQFGKFTNIIHTFGNGIALQYDVQQGVVHGIMAPHVLRYVFDRVDGKRRMVADGLGVETEAATDSEIAAEIVDTVIDIRDSLDLLSQLRTVPGLERAHLPAIAETIASNGKHRRNPPGLDPTVGEITTILESAW